MVPRSAQIAPAVKAMTSVTLPKATQFIRSLTISGAGCTKPPTCFAPKRYKR
jgi:hypothetical protein